MNVRLRKIRWKQTEQVRFETGSLSWEITEHPGLLMRGTLRSCGFYHTHNDCTLTWEPSPCSTSCMSYLRRAENHCGTVLRSPDHSVGDSWAGLKAERTDSSQIMTSLLENYCTMQTTAWHRGKEKERVSIHSTTRHKPQQEQLFRGSHQLSQSHEQHVSNVGHFLYKYSHCVASECNKQTSNRESFWMLWLEFMDNDARCLHFYDEHVILCTFYAHFWKSSLKT